MQVCRTIVARLFHCSFFCFVRHFYHLEQSIAAKKGKVYSKVYPLFLTRIFKNKQGQSKSQASFVYFLPSENDRLFTNRLKQCCELMVIDLLDHIIVGQDSYTSFREESWL
ncbi:JAB domain-containing protein [Candidatus Enterococcus lowellii]|uniref:JAB domain-containing protein n=1 Tax=Candidatus Enterococcus lowellii TaxID=2230877 RepID=UPI001A9F3F45|nr:hypothetical protein [Enterococcus sp. DIV2402]